jgi:hypothetical protein
MLFRRVESIEDDTDLSDIDRLSIRYTGKPFGTRTGLGSPPGCDPTVGPLGRSRNRASPGREYRCEAQHS